MRKIFYYHFCAVVIGFAITILPFHLEKKLSNDTENQTGYLYLQSFSN